MSSPAYRVDSSEAGILVVHCAGDLSPEDAAELLEVVGADRDRRLVIDVSQLQHIDRAARRLIADRLSDPATRSPSAVSTKPGTPSSRSKELAVVGGTFRSRLVITSLLVEGDALANAQFFENMGDAIAWARQTRVTIAPPPPLRNG